MPTRRPRRAGAHRRTGALDAAALLLAQRGYDRTRFTDVAQASGVAVSTLQYYFGSREDMLIEALSRAMEQEVATAEDAAATAGGPWQRLVALVDHRMSAPSATWRLRVEFWRTAAHDAELRERSLQLQERYRRLFVRAIEEGSRTGEFRPVGTVSDLTTTLVAQLDGLAFPHLLAHPSVTGKHGLREIAVALLAAAIGAEPVPSAEHPAS